MARDPKIDARLMRWAQAVTVGDGSGYPIKCVLHEDWSPPGGGITPTMKVAPASDVRETHRAISALSLRLRNTVAVHYVIKGAVADQALMLDCAVDTVHARVEEAHRQIAKALGSYCNIHEPG